MNTKTLLIITFATLSVVAAVSASETIIGNLHVSNGTSDPSVMLHGRASDGASALRFLDNNGNNHNWAIVGYSDFLTIHDGAANHPFRILSNGNVGIGTTGPSFLLDVAGVAQLEQLRFESISEHYMSGSNDPYIFSAANGFEGESGMFGSLVLQSRSDTGRPIVFVTGAPADERMRITSGGAGVVGIGTDTPEATLHVKNGESASNYYVFQAETAGGGKSFSIANNGSVGIGTTDTNDYKLTVKGSIKAEEIVVETIWSHFVFEDGYQLRPLEEVESHIEEYGRLPDVPSAAAVKSKGLSVGEAQKIMMQKIEELTLYVIELKKENEVQQREIEKLKTN